MVLLVRGRARRVLPDQRLNLATEPKLSGNPSRFRRFATRARSRAISVLGWPGCHIVEASEHVLESKTRHRREHDTLTQMHQRLERPPLRVASVASGRWTDTVRASLQETTRAHEVQSDDWVAPHRPTIRAERPDGFTTVFDCHQMGRVQGEIAERTQILQSYASPQLWAYCPQCPLVDIGGSVVSRLGHT
jgi:hypothetical protein